MNILCIYEFDLSVKRGASIHSLELIDNLAKFGNKLFIFCPKFNKENIDTNAKVYRISFLRLGKFIIPLLSFQFSSLFHLLSLKHRQKINLVYHRISGVSSIVGLYCKILRIPYICEVNGLIQGELDIAHSPKIIKLLSRTFESFTYKMAKKIIVVTPGIKRELQRMFNISQKKVIVVPNGANVNLFKPISNAREKLGLNPNYNYVGFVGNLTRWQGVEYLVKAAPEIIKKESSVRFLIVGEGIMRKRLEKLIKNLNVESYFRFLGNVKYEETPMYINAFDVCVAPWTEKRNKRIGLSPLKLYEYLACGKPVVASDIEGVGDLLKKYKLGLAVPCDKYMPLAEAIVELLINKELKKEMGINARNIIVRNYSWRITAKKVEDIFVKILNE